MKRLFNWLKWLDDQLLTILLVLFIFFIPLYPKFPYKIIEYTYIAVRIEDFYIAFFGFVFLIQLIRRKVKLDLRFLIPVIIFWVMVFAAFYYGAYVERTIAVINLGFLHATRRVEYMMIFFITASAIRSEKTFKVLIHALFISFALVTLYGIGQRFLGFPAVSTMNPEFARGHILYLTPEARVSSTFAGHYDLAMYLVFLIPLTLGWYFSAKGKPRLLLLFSALTAVYVLVLTVSRISFMAYLASTFLFLLIARKFRYFLLMLVFTFIVTITNTDLTTRFKRTIQIKQILVNEETGQVFVPQTITTKELPLGTLYVPLPKPATPAKGPAVGTITSRLPTVKTTSTATAALKKKIATEVITQEAARAEKILSATEEARLIASLSAVLNPISGVVCDISCSTRLQVEWPRALAAFFNNPFFGAGPSSITEATDNDYLRWLGEFGLTGFLVFMYILLALAYFIVRAARKSQTSYKLLFHAYPFALLGLMITASYLDTFEASKLAYVFWYTSGLFYGVLSLTRQSKTKQATS